MIINTNINVINSLNVGRQTGLRVNTAMERLGTALRINRGEDDPSGLAITKSMKARARGQQVAIQNIQDGISFLQIRDAVAAEAGDMLLRLKELAVRAANEAPMTDLDRQRLQNEAASLVSQLNKFNESATYNGIKVFDISFDTVKGGSFGFYTGGIASMSLDLSEIYAQTGNQPVTLRFTWYDGAAFFPDANLLSPDGTEAFGWLYSPNNGAPGVVEAYSEYQDEQLPPANTVNRGDGDLWGIGTMDSADSIQYNGWGPPASPGGYFEEVFVVDNPAPGLWSLIIDNEQPDDKLFGVFINEDSRAPIERNFVQVGPDGNPATNSFNIKTYEINSIALHLTASLTTVANARDSLETIDDAIETLNTRRAEDGARVRRLMTIVNDTSAEYTNVEAARSRIEDTDMAQEITEMTKNQIIQQTNLSVTAQAGVDPELAMQLINVINNTQQLP